MFRWWFFKFKKKTFKDYPHTTWPLFSFFHPQRRNCRNPTLAKCRGESQHSQSWGLGVLRDSQMFRVWQQGPKHIALKCSWCHWKGLEAWISKMASHWPFEHLSPKLWAKEGPGVKLVVWLPTTKKSGIDLFPTSEQRVRHGVEKISTRATSLVQTLLRSDLAVGSYKRPKSRDSSRNSFGIISGLQLGSPGKKSHLDVVPEMWRREYYIGEGGGFPRVRAVVCLVVQSARGLSQHPRVFPNVN
jgi:hypothetical protein